MCCHEDDAFPGIIRGFHEGDYLTHNGMRMHIGQRYRFASYLRHWRLIGVSGN